MTHPLTRQQICELTAAQLAAATPNLKSTNALIGLDGFVDEIISVVNKRHGAGDQFDPIRTIGELGGKITTAAGHSSNYELVVKQRKLGGNGPIMADALAALGCSVTYIGNLGFPTLDPVFDEFAKRAKVLSIGQPAHTDALEFDDGKLMLGKLQPLHEVNWDNLISRVGHDQLAAMMSQSQLIGMVNWTMLPHMSRIWAKLLDEVIPNIQRHQRKLFVDLADPEKRTHDDILDALKLLTRFQDQVDVILGLNLKESLEVADVLKLPGRTNPDAAIVDNACAIRATLGLSCVTIHTRRTAAAATEGTCTRFDGPFLHQPKISTGAGDHFNAGFSLGQTLAFPLEQSLCLGVATSGYYVRHAQSPTAPQLAEFVANLPDPQN